MSAPDFICAPLLFPVPLSWNGIIESNNLLYQASFTSHNAYEIHPCGYPCPWLVPFITKSQLTRGFSTLYFSIPIDIWVIPLICCNYQSYCHKYLCSDVDLDFWLHFFWITKCDFWACGWCVFWFYLLLAFGVTLGSTQNLLLTRGSLLVGLGGPYGVPGIELRSVAEKLMPYPLY